jgi:hypothetical protein
MGAMKEQRWKMRTKWLGLSQKRAEACMTVGSSPCDSPTRKVGLPVAGENSPCIKEKGSNSLELRADRLSDFRSFA